MKKHCLLTLLAILPIMVNAAAVEIDGVYYNLITKGNVAEVTSNPNKYTGTVSIPEKVNYNNVEYRVTSIESYAFCGCSDLITITIPNSVTCIGYRSFDGCQNLSNVKISGNLTNIGDLAFANCKRLSSIDVPNSLLSIGESAFNNCGLTSITIPNKITTIEKLAFANCKDLSSVSIPSSVTTIGKNAFHGCGLPSVTIPSSVTSIGDGAFGQCHKLTNITIPNSVKSIGSEAFNYCVGLTTVIIGKGVTTIGSAAFYDCRNLSTIVIGENVKSIGQSAFFNCFKISEIIIPNNVTVVNDYVFSNCTGLVSVIMGDNVKTIGSNTFYNCKNLTTVKMGNSVSSIGSFSFMGCKEIKDFYISALINPTAMSDTFLESYIEYATLHVPVSAINLYMNADPWKRFGSFVAIDGNEITQKCSIPTISYTNGRLSFSCDTEGVEYVTEITDADIKMHYDASISLSNTYNVSVYATKPGYDNSDVATATFSWNGIEPLIEGSVAKYRLSYIVDNKEISVRNVEYGATISAPSTDSEGNNVTWYTYPSTMPAHDLVVYGMTVKEPEVPEPVEPEPEVFVWLTVNDSQSGYMKIKVKQGAEQTLNFTAEEGWKISNIFMDGRYVTSRLAEDGTFVTPAITSDASIIIMYEETVPSGARTATQSQAEIKVVSDGVVISNAEPDTRCTIYQTDGKQVVNTVIDEGTRKITLQQGQAYIMTINGRTLKFAL